MIHRHSPSLEQPPLADVKRSCSPASSSVSPDATKYEPSFWALVSRPEYRFVTFSESFIVAMLNMQRRKRPNGTRTSVSPSLDSHQDPFGSIDLEVEQHSEYLKPSLLGHSMIDHIHPTDRERTALQLNLLPRNPAVEVPTVVVCRYQNLLKAELFNRLAQGHSPNESSVIGSDITDLPDWTDTAILVTQVTDDLWLCCFYTAPNTFTPFVSPSANGFLHARSHLQQQPTAVHIGLVESQLQRCGVKFISRKGFTITVESSSSSGGRGAAGNGGGKDSWSTSRDSQSDSNSGSLPLSASIFQVYEPQSLELLLALPQEQFEQLMGPAHEEHEEEGLVFSKTFLKNRCHPKDFPRLLETIAQSQRTRLSKVSKPEDLGIFTVQHRLLTRSAHHPHPIEQLKQDEQALPTPPASTPSANSTTSEDSAGPWGPGFRYRLVESRFVPFDSLLLVCTRIRIEEQQQKNKRNESAKMKKKKKTAIDYILGTAAPPSTESMSGSDPTTYKEGSSESAKPQLTIETFSSSPLPHPHIQQKGKRSQLDLVGKESSLLEQQGQQQELQQQQQGKQREKQEREEDDLFQEEEQEQQQRWKIMKRMRTSVASSSVKSFQCENCNTTDSPEWRRGPSGHKSLCNACGLRYARKQAKVVALQQKSQLSAKTPPSADVGEATEAAATAVRPLIQQPMTAVGYYPSAMPLSASPYGHYGSYGPPPYGHYPYVPYGTYSSVPPPSYPLLPPVPTVPTTTLGLDPRLSFCSNVIRPGAPPPAVPTAPYTRLVRHSEPPLNGGPIWMDPAPLAPWSSDYPSAQPSPAREDPNLRSLPPVPTAWTPTGVSVPVYGPYLPYASVVPAPASGQWGVPHSRPLERPAMIPAHVQTTPVTVALGAYYPAPTTYMPPLQAEGLRPYMPWPAVQQPSHAPSSPPPPP